MIRDPRIRIVRAEDRPWVEDLLRDRWGALTIAVHDTVYHPADLPGFIAELHEDPAERPISERGPGGFRAGLVTCVIAGNECEIVTLDSLAEGRGIGTALIGAVLDAAREAQCSRLWLVTTNDNLHAADFYRRRGFRLEAIHAGAVDRARQLKPEIPQLGMGGVRIRDELEFEMKI